MLVLLLKICKETPKYIYAISKVYRFTFYMYQGNIFTL